MVTTKIIGCDSPLGAGMVVTTKIIGYDSPLGAGMVVTTKIIGCDSPLGAGRGSNEGQPRAGSRSGEGGG